MSELVDNNFSSFIIPDDWLEFIFSFIEIEYHLNLLLCCKRFNTLIKRREGDWKKFCITEWKNGEFQEKYSHELLEKAQKESLKSWYWFYTCFKGSLLTQLYNRVSECGVFIGKCTGSVDGQKLCGRGIWIVDDKIRTGQFFNNELNGYGITIGSNWSYHGEYDRGDQRGTGTYENESGTKYTGRWNRYGLCDGFATITYFDGTSYETHWKNEIPSK